MREGEQATAEVGIILVVVLVVIVVAAVVMAVVTDMEDVVVGSMGDIMKVMQSL